MRTVIQGNKLTVTLKATDRDLTEEEIIMAHQLAIGDYKALFIKTDETVEENRDQTDFVDPMDLNYGDPVMVDVSCPVCGRVGETKGRYGNRYTKCPNRSCATELFNSPAGESFGDLDQRGNMYHAHEVYKKRGNDSYGSNDLLDEMIQDVL